MPLEVAPMVMSVAIKMGWIYTTRRRTEWRDGRWQISLDAFIPMYRNNADLIPKLRNVMNLASIDAQTFGDFTSQDISDRNELIKPNAHEEFFARLKRGDFNIDPVTYILTASNWRIEDRFVPNIGNPDDEELGRPD